MQWTWLCFVSIILVNPTWSSESYTKWGHCRGTSDLASCGVWHPQTMMTSSNGNIFHVNGHLCGEFTGHRLIPLTKASDTELWCFLWYAWINGWVNKQSQGWSFETPSCPLLRHCDVAILCFYDLLLQSCDLFTYVASDSEATLEAMGKIDEWKTMKSQQNTFWVHNSCDVVCSWLIS